LEKWTVEAGVTAFIQSHTGTQSHYAYTRMNAHTHTHKHTHTQGGTVDLQCFGLLLPPALITSVQSSHDPSLLPLVDLGIKRVFPLNIKRERLFRYLEITTLCRSQMENPEGSRFDLFAPPCRG